MPEPTAAVPRRARRTRKKGRPAPEVALLDAALQLFERQTYAGTAVPAVAARAGVAVGSVYRYFPGKEALANAVFRRAKQDLLAAVRKEVAQADPSDTQGLVAAWWRGLGRFGQAQPEALAFLEHQQHAAYLDEESRAVSAEVEAAALTVLRAGQDAGEVRDAPAELLLALVFGAFVGLSKAARDAGRVPDDAELAVAGAAVWALLARPTGPTDAPAVAHNEETP